MWQILDFGDFWSRPARLRAKASNIEVHTHFGEKVVLRLLGSARTPTLHSLGLSAGETALLDDALSQPQGLILVTGPTGAGKSTTLYSMLARRQSAEVNIVTIEDPIEYFRDPQADASAQGGRRPRRGRFGVEGCRDGRRHTLPARRRARESASEPHDG
jgi:Tfp pilus assembly pilus retraction ATPase PilT